MRTTNLLVSATLLIMVGFQGGAEQLSSGGAQEPKATTQQDQQATDATMAQWKSYQGEEGDWVAQELAKHKVVTPADNSDLIGRGQGSVYGAITSQDVKIWDRETYKLAVEGSRIFHSADRLKSEIAVSCDMCHPDASNNHPETYPKFQVQLGRVALLRDMINWCVEHPVRGKKLEPDSPEMRALEAYLLAQRKGVALQYGKR
jgi:thiosulfate dehydrogenase